MSSSTGTSSRQRALCPGKAKPKKPSEHKIVGKPVTREDMAPKVFGQAEFWHRRQGAGHGSRPDDPPRRSPAQVPVTVDEPRSRTSRACKVVW